MNFVFFLSNYSVFFNMGYFFSRIIIGIILIGGDISYLPSVQGVDLG